MSTVYIAGGIALALLVLVAAVGIGARLAGSRISKLPDPFPTDVLRAAPEGTYTFVDRPDGTRLRVVSTGNGRTVVLAHGYGVDLSTWNLMYTDLARRGYRVIAFDQRGHGQSTIGRDGIGSAQMAGDYLAIFQSLDVRDAVLVGHSMGGFIGIRAILDLPDLGARLRGLVLMATVAGRVLRGAPQNRIQAPMLRAGLFQRALASPVTGIALASTICGDDPSPAQIQVFRESFATADHVKLIPIIRALAKEDYYPRLREIALPTLVVYGGADRNTPEWHARRLTEGIPGARLIRVDGKGHLIYWEAAQAMVEVVESLTGTARDASSH